MPSPLQLTALGAPVDLHFSGPRAEVARAAFDGVWGLCLRPGDEPALRVVDVVLGRELADDDGARTVGCADLAALMTRVTQRVTLHAIQANVGSLLMLHAAALCDAKSGAAVVAVAPGGVGKTTFCRELGTGRGYLSDETVGIRADGSIVAYPKPLSVRRDHAEGKDEVAPGALGLAPADAPPYVVAMLLLDRDDAHQGPPVFDPLDSFDAIVRLTPETSSLCALPRPLHRLQDLLESLSGVSRVRYRDVSTLEPYVAELLGATG